MEGKRLQRPAASNLYSMLSANACQLASMIFSETRPSPLVLMIPDSISTRTFDSVPLFCRQHADLYSPSSLTSRSCG